MAITTPDYTVTPAGADYGDPEDRRSGIIRNNEVLTEVATARVAVVDIFDISGRAATDRSWSPRTASIRPERQAGLSWFTILNKRDNYRKAFDRFDARKIARYDQPKVDALLADAGIVRNRLKIAAAIGNAQPSWRCRRSSAPLTTTSGRFVGHEPKQNAWKSIQEVPGPQPRNRMR